MSNHVVRDFVSLLQQNGMTCYEVYGKEELDTFNIAKILRQSNMTLNSANVRIISVMDISRELERKISKLKIESCGNAQIILLVNDLWRNRDIVTFQDKFEFADYFFHMDPYAIQGLSRVHQSKCHFFPFAGLNQSIFFPDSKKEVIFFSGNVNSSYRRKFIDALLSNFRGSYLRVQINGFHYLQRSRIPTMQDYAKQLNRARICLDLGKKEDRYWVLTGRSLEALASGCFLILDEPKTGGPLSLLFTKGVHYKSFESIEELIDLVREFDVNIQLATNIASAAHARYLELFNHKRLVGYLDEILRREFNSLID
jgi:hypothetical protein